MSLAELEVSTIEHLQKQLEILDTKINNLDKKLVIYHFDVQFYHKIIGQPFAVPSHKIKVRVYVRENDLKNASYSDKCIQENPKYVKCIENLINEYQNYRQTPKYNITGAQFHITNVTQ